MSEFVIVQRNGRELPYPSLEAAVYALAPLHRAEIRYPRVTVGPSKELGGPGHADMDAEQFTALVAARKALRDAPVEIPVEVTIEVYTPERVERWARVGAVPDGKSLTVNSSAFEYAPVPDGATHVRFTRHGVPEEPATRLTPGTDRTVFVPPPIDLP